MSFAHSNYFLPAKYVAIAVPIAVAITPMSCQRSFSFSVMALSVSEPLNLITVEVSVVQKYGVFRAQPNEILDILVLLKVEPIIAALLCGLPLFSEGNHTCMSVA